MTIGELGPAPTIEEVGTHVTQQFMVLNARLEVVADCRVSLSEALALADLYPAPTPEETLLIDQQVNAALAEFRALVNPPADVVALAAAVISWRTEI